MMAIVARLSFRLAKRTPAFPTSILRPFQHLKNEIFVTLVEIEGWKSRAGNGSRAKNRLSGLKYRKV